MNDFRPHKIIAVTAFGLLLGVTIFSWWRDRPKIREGDLYEIRANGRVFDYANRQPIPDAWVLIGLHTSNSSFGGNGGGCYYGSTVVKTDANGEFSYRATIRKAGNGASGFWTVVYHPNYAGELQWKPLTTQGVTIFPIYHRLDGVPLYIAMARRDTDEWDALAGIYEYSRQACVDFPMEKGQAEFSRMRYERTLALHCGPTPRAGPFPLEDVQGDLEARLVEQEIYEMPVGPERNWPSHDEQIARLSYVATRLLPNYPWDSSQDSGDARRDLTSQEKAAFCTFYSLPIENLINKDYLP